MKTSGKKHWPSNKKRVHRSKKKPHAQLEHGEAKQMKPKPIKKHKTLPKHPPSEMDPKFKKMSFLKNIDSNWQQLSQVLQSENTKKRKRLGVHGKPKEKQNEKAKANETKRNVDIWFDDVDKHLLETNEKETNKMQDDQSKINTNTDDQLVKNNAYSGLTKEVAMDCEMVGIGPGGKESILARVSLVNHDGECFYDKYVKPQEVVTDYRTAVSGIRPEHLINGEEFETVQKEVSSALNNRILVGHALHNDLKVLYLNHPKNKIRDTSRYKPFRALFDGRNPSLKKLTQKLLDVKVQTGEHSSIQDAQAAMRLYTLKKKEWERAIKEKRKTKVKNITNK